MAIIKLSKGEQRRLSVFFTCLVIAFMAWILTTLSNQYEYTIKTVVSFTNPPLRRSFRSLQSDTIDAVVQGNGWNHLFSKINIDNKMITVSLKSLDTKNYVLLSSQLAEINKKRQPNQQIVAFTPDTLYFDFSSRAVKRVPVQLQYKLSFKQQSGISDNITVKPDYVTISGPAQVIDKIKSWKTDSLTLKNVDDSVDVNLRLQGVKESNMIIYPKTVEVRVPVDEFTEKVVELPVKLINNKSYYNVKMFPQKVKVVFTVSLNKYAKINEQNFEAVADLDLWKEHGYKQLPVKLTRFPAFCKLVSIEPQNIDFIIKE